MKWIRPLRKMIIVVVIIVIGVAVIVVGNRHAQAVKVRRAHSLFTGPHELVDVADTTYYPRPSYNLAKYSEYAVSGAEVAAAFEEEEKAPRDLDEVDGAGREQLEAMIRARGQVDAITGATTIERLRTSTVYRNRRPSPFLAISYPPDSAVFPPNLCEPCVEWDDPVNTLWQITVGISDADQKWQFISTERQWSVPR